MSEFVESYKHAMRHMVQPVSILTHQKQGEIYGMTVSSATSYSAEPPMFMAAIHKECTLARALSLGDHLAMNLLEARHEELAMRFSGQTGVQGDTRFEEGAWLIGDDAAPRLDGALAAFSGKLHALIPQASHAILLVKIDQIKEGQGSPLHYYQKRYLKNLNI